MEGAEEDPPIGTAPQPQRRNTCDDVPRGAIALAPARSSSAPHVPPRRVTHPSGCGSSNKTEAAKRRGSLSEVAPSKKSGFGAGAKNYFKAMVSQDRKRYIADGFNLDLTYITSRLIAMGFPCMGSEGMYRNDMAQVVRFFESKHSLEHVQVFNLVGETGREYDSSHFRGQVSHFPFLDHQVPALYQIHQFCTAVHYWLIQDEANVAAVHCLAGKGRTGLMMCAYLVAHGKLTPDEAISHFGVERTGNPAGGLTVPSQKRYVHYWGQVCQSEDLEGSILHPPPAFGSLSATPGGPPRTLDRITLVTTPLMGWFSSPDCTPHVHITTLTELLCEVGPSSTCYRTTGDDHTWEFSPAGIVIAGDVRFRFFHNRTEMFQVWLNTHFVDSHQVYFKQELDMASKDKDHKKFDAKLAIHLHFSA